MSNVSLITKLGLIVTTAGALTIGVRYNSQYGDISKGIAELKNRGMAYMQMYNKSAGDLEELQGIYEGILDKLGLEKGADLETITNKIDSITNAEQLKEIATALGLEPTADVATITNKIEELNTKVKNLQTEIENAKTDLKQANSEQGKLLSEIETALEAVPALEGDTPSEQEPSNGEEPGEGDSVTGGTGDSGEVGEDTTIEGGEEELTEEQQALKATMDEAWQAVDTELTALGGVTESEKEAVKAGNYVVNGSLGYKAIFVNDRELGMVKYSLETALEAYKTAKTNYENSLK